MGKVPDQTEGPLEESFSAFAGRYHEPQQWVIENLIPVGGLIVLSGPPKSLKTWLGLRAVTCAATGREFLGRKVKQGPAIYILEEGAPAAVADRIRKMAGTSGAPENAYLVLRKGIKLDTNAGIEAIADVISRVNPVLTVIDPMIKVHTREENDAGAMGGLMGDILALTELGTAIAIVHHTAKRTEGYASAGGAARGSGAITSSSDGNLMLTKVGDSRDEGGALIKVRLRMETEMRDGEDEKISLQWDPATGDFEISSPSPTDAVERPAGGVAPSRLVQLVDAESDGLSAPKLASLVGISEPTARVVLRAGVDRGDLVAIETKRPILYRRAA